MLTVKLAKFNELFKLNGQFINHIIEFVIQEIVIGEITIVIEIIVDFKPITIPITNSFMIHYFSL